MTYNEFIQNIIDTRGQWSDEVKNSPRGCERHHIIPRCIGGEGDRRKKHPNIIWLYPSEHYIAHKLLALENPDNFKLVSAWNFMYNCVDRITDEEKVITAEEYETLRNAFNENLRRIERSTEWRKNIGESNRRREHNYGEAISVTKKKNNAIKDGLRLTELVEAIDMEEFIEVYYHNTDDNIITWCKSKFNKFYRRDIQYLLNLWGLHKKTTKEINDIKISTMYKNYGVVNNFQRQEIKEKCKNTKLEKYGDEYYSNHEKAQNTILEKYGTKNMFYYYKKLQSNTGEVLNI